MNYEKIPGVNSLSVFEKAVRVGVCAKMSVRRYNVTVKETLLMFSWVIFFNYQQANS